MPGRGNLAGHFLRIVVSAKTNCARFPRRKKRENLEQKLKESDNRNCSDNRQERKGITMSETYIRRGFHCDKCGQPAHESGENAGWFSDQQVLCFDCGNKVFPEYMVLGMGYNQWEKSAVFDTATEALAAIEQLKTLDECVKVVCWIVGESDKVLHEEIKEFGRGWIKR